MKQTTLLLFSSLLAGSLCAQDIDLDKELVARYLFNGNARNEVEDKNHGLETNVQFETDRFAKPNSCLSLSGDDSYVTIPHTDDLNWDARSESYSILFWVKSPDPTHGGETGIRVLSKWSENLQKDPYPFSFPCSETVLLAAIREVNTPPLLCTINGIWDDQWHHVAMIFNHELQEMSLYFDNFLFATNTKQTNSSTLNEVDIQIGMTPIRNVFYKGYVDDLYFYNKVVNACEIEALYSGNLINER